MMIKNSNYIPGAVSTPYSVQKSEAVSGASNKSNAVKLNQISVPKNLDTIEISKQAIQSKTSLSQTRDQILADINQDKDISFLETLKAKIQANEYKIDSKELSRILTIGTNSED
ncbi:flagellar biosynthesis anti-sigma factor FlgM [Caproiciproducens sp. LBM24188]